MKKTFITSLTCLALFSASCGGNQSTTVIDSTVNASNQIDTMSAQDIAREMSVKAIPGIDTVKTSNEITLTGDDLMKFNVTLFKVKAGEPVTLSFKNIGKQPKNVMAHNVIILTQGTDVEAFAQAAMIAKANDYIPETLTSDIISHTKLLGPDESDKITFTLNDKGAYHFLCSFPGHHSIMNGKIVAE